MFAIKFKPMNEIELIEAENEARGLLEDGTYKFVVFNSSHAISKTSGNDMLKLTLKIWDDKGKEHLIFDYLIFSGKPFNTRKIKHFCESVGLLKEYEQGELSENLCNLSGTVKIIVKKGELKPDGSKYFDRNEVDDYLKSTEIESKKQDDFPQDDIPF